jgi:ribonuclease D
LEDPRLYEPDPAAAWERLRGIDQLSPTPRARAKTVAIWRERLARERDLPRSWIIPDAAIFAVAQENPTSRAELNALHAMPMNFNEAFATSLLRTLHEESTVPVTDMNPSQDARPTPEQKAMIERLAKIVDARAAELGVGAELLAPRGELKALAMGKRDTHALTGWRRSEIGDRLLSRLS